MRTQNKIIVAFFLIITFYCLSGCKKTDLSPPEDNLAKKINVWLDLQKENFNKNGAFIDRIANIDLLRENLEINAKNFEQLNDKLNVLIVPVKDTVINRKNLNKNASLALLLIMNKNEKILSGSIVYFQPADQQKHGRLPENTFSNMLNRKNTVLDGKY